MVFLKINILLETFCNELSRKVSYALYCQCLFLENDPSFDFPTIFFHEHHRIYKKIPNCFIQFPQKFRSNLAQTPGFYQFLILPVETEIVLLSRGIVIFFWKKKKITILKISTESYQKIIEPSFLYKQILYKQILCKKILFFFL